MKRSGEFELGKFVDCISYSHSRRSSCQGWCSVGEIEGYRGIPATEGNGISSAAKTSMNLDSRAQIGLYANIKDLSKILFDTHC